MMTSEEMDEILVLLAEANPKTIFLELAFVESWTQAVRKRDGVVAVDMLTRSLPFFEREFRWIPRPVKAPTRELAWVGRAATLATTALCGLAGLSSVLG